MKDRHPVRTYIIKKIILIIAHIIGVILLAGGIVAISSHAEFRQGIKNLNPEDYEETEEFSVTFNESLTLLFDYLDTREIFETDNKFDPDKQVFSINEGPTVDTEYTIADVIATAKKLGYYLDDEYQIVSAPDTSAISDAATSYIVNWKNYDDTESLTQPGDSYMTIDELIQEVLGKLGRYYHAYDRLVLKPTNFYYRVQYGPEVFTNNKDLNETNAVGFGKYAIAKKDVIQVESNLRSLPPDIQYLAENCIYNDGDDYIAIAAVDTTYALDDIFKQQSAEYLRRRETYFTGLLIIFIGLALVIISLFLLVVHAVRHTDDYLHDRLPHSDSSFEGRIFACALAIIVLLFVNDRVIAEIIDIYMPEYSALADKALGYVLVYSCVIVTAFSIFRSYLAQDIWTKSLTKQWYDSIDKYIDENSFSRRLAIVFFGFVFVSALMVAVAVAIFCSDNSLIERFIAIAIILVFIAGNITVLLILYKKTSQFDKISDAIKNIAGGNTGYQLNVNEFDGKERTLAEELNSLGNGLDTALSEKMRSERLKTDLITNVSHDIKTPLTSIINYIDLIKRENPSDPRIVEYLEVLDQKSQHLKNLTEDLVEASKVSSGNVTLDMHTIDFNEMVQQANGEFEEKFASRNLTIVANLPKEAMLIQADGNSLWRVLENLYNNAFKYAAENSRVYVDMIAESVGKTVMNDLPSNSDTFIGKDPATGSAGKVTFTIKNMSRNPLNISADELTERFVRGDVSRSTEGSGLGLSIAESLTRLQDGDFRIDIDGDLFKVSVRFTMMTMR